MIPLSKIRILVFTTITVLGSTISSSSQVKTKLSGIVLDSLSKKGLDYVTVSLVKKDGMEVFFSTYTDSVGRFSLAVDTGTYKLSFNYLGYKRHDILLNGKKILDHKEIRIQLQNNSGQLNDVNVVAAKTLVEQDKDKITYIAENDPMAKNETATEILRKTPMLSVDGDGNVQINGKSNFKVLLNGRETSTFARNVKEALMAFPGSAISKIEVITSPSAKYDAEGTEGLINIITKKSIAGYNGYLSVNYSTVNYASSTNFSYRTGKFGVTGSYALSGNNNNPSQSVSVTEPVVLAIFSQRRLSGNRMSDRFYNNGNLEAVYDLDSLNFIILYGSVTGGNNSSSQEQQILTTFTNNNISVNPFIQESRNAFPEFGIGSEFLKKYKKKGQELSLKLNTVFGRNEGSNISFLSNENQWVLRDNDSRAKNNEYTLQTDFVKPLLRLETGNRIQSNSEKG